MALILSIETSTTVCSVALHSNGNLVGLKELHLDKSHSEYLIPIIKDLLAYCGKHQNDLEAIAISKGPGSYTGLRIGASTAKGLCYALNIPLIAISTLRGMAKQIRIPINENTLLCPMLDARRMEVYASLYNYEYQNVLSVQPVIIDESSFNDYFNDHKLIFFGNGSEKCKGVLNKKAVFIDKIFPSATTIGELAIEKYLGQYFEDIAYFEPFYLKEFQTTTPRKKPF
ncbi:MAG: tRNA (adenosine(37)-N6)-threonylcarbamoyltransferase complex dimerization subunit type 1 TsaB [Cyclobacteriaceae bacterium]|nr:tRNA (adenosine(37)-N6)-threonylcarbamoyltransferase complex dimerization subunit type 1 TsaB [Cyclobacteriaceae bacterium]